MYGFVSLLGSIGPSANLKVEDKVKSELQGSSLMSLFCGFGGVSPFFRALEHTFHDTRSKSAGKRVRINAPLNLFSHMTMCQPKFPKATQAILLFYLPWQHDVPTMATSCTYHGNTMFTANSKSLVMFLLSLTSAPHLPLKKFNFRKF